MKIHGWAQFGGAFFTTPDEAIFRGQGCADERSPLRWSEPKLALRPHDARAQVDLSAVVFGGRQRATRLQRRGPCQLRFPRLAAISSCEFPSSKIVGTEFRTLRSLDGAKRNRGPASPRILGCASLHLGYGFKAPSSRPVFAATRVSAPS